MKLGAFNFTDIMEGSQDTLSFWPVEERAFSYQYTLPAPAADIYGVI